MQCEFVTVKCDAVFSRLARGGAGARVTAEAKSGVDGGLWRLQPQKVKLEPQYVREL